MFGGNNGGGQSNVGGMGGQHGPVIGQGTGIAKPSAGIFRHIVHQIFSDVNQYTLKII